ncbi:hypothetical protein B0H14DRAFT_2632383 [Mycena olivaceomarginata]|nr:hypothetical protein B0H14DRAFT_2632383 [Mycena olivaceomarginata]
MHTPSLATNVIGSREELMVAIATVDELVVRAVRLTHTAQALTRTAEDIARTAQDLQVRLPILLDRQNEREAEDHIWVHAKRLRWAACLVRCVCQARVGRDAR